jgi:DNA-binding MarR family transcriptional regulator
MSYSLAELIGIISREISEREQYAFEKSQFKELTPRQLAYIEAVAQLHEATLSEVAAFLHVTKPSASVVLDRLTDMGYVKKVKSDNDRRVSHLHLREKGLQAAGLHERVHAEAAARIKELLSPRDIESLINILNIVVKEMDHYE